ncbi:MAG: peptidyl-prolyl cis-trans isomerase C [Rhodobacteraceae bacterium HLUCCA08]|nr:MAG: peptidyl-prolyl cis-trans isomerase C [Rhodobacteraceae bacterium HLUCCA08]
MNALFPDLIVNGETVPAAQVAAETQNHPGPRGKPGIAWRKAANAIAVRTLLLQEARRRGLAPQPRELAPGRFETEEEALIRGLLDQAVGVSAPSEPEVRAEWAREPARFRAPPLWEVSHILVACDPADRSGKTAAAERAGYLTQQVLAGAESFADIARAHSDCASRDAGGSLGQLTPGDTVPEFKAALRSLDAGSVTHAPVRTRHGWHIIRMDAVAAGAELPYDAVRHRISEAMEKTAWARAARAFVQSLVAKAEVVGADLRPLPAEGATDDAPHP